LIFGIIEYEDMAIEDRFSEDNSIGESFLYIEDDSLSLLLED
jgi:hypothetical protein